MKIFETYTGNAMLNNALMTIEALSGLNNVSEITLEILLKLYRDKSLLALNKRLKSYTMLFTKNGPLHNDKARGDKTYDALFKTILNNFENEGDKICEISGLKFNTSFNALYEKALKDIGVSESGIKKKDTNLSRTWFPLIGGLGSDAQALPQAKFSVQIHPICIAILQFLPLSALLYNGGILLIDSSNFELSRRYIKDNQKILAQKIELAKTGESIENVRDFSKGSYVLKALSILEDKNFDDEYSDLNLWSFSNSGTGASCSIDKIPNSLFQKLNILYNNPEVNQELKNILNNPNGSNSFLSSLEDNSEWWLLYPNVFKKIKYEGVSVNFLEAYFKVIKSDRKIIYAKYLAYLIDKYKSKSFSKYLESSSAWDKNDYRIDLYKVLVESTLNGKWSFHHHLNILDNPNQLPSKNTFYNIHKLIHFYYQKGTFGNVLPELKNEVSLTKTVAEWLIGVIQNDIKSDSIIKDFRDPQKYSLVRYAGLMLRTFEASSLNLDIIITSLFDDDLKMSVLGLNELLRLFFIQTEKQSFVGNNIPLDKELDMDIKEKINDIKEFAKDYQGYYFDKYENKETGVKPYKRFLKLISDISFDTSKFLYWFREAVENTNSYLFNKELDTSEKWSEELIYNHNGDFALSFAKLAIKFSLLKQYHESFLEQNQTINS